MLKIRKNDEAWRLLYIRLLTEDLGEDEAKPADLQGFSDLIDAGFMKGRALTNSLGEIVGASVQGPTLQGRLFAEEQQRLISEGSVWGLIKKGTGLGVGWISGFASSVLLYYLTN